MEKSLKQLTEIQASLHHIKSKIQIIGKNQLRNMQSIQKTFNSSLSIINRKLEDCQKKQQYNQRLNPKNLLNNTKIQLARQQKMIHQKQLNRTRQILSAIKLNESQIVKSQSITNQQIISQQKNMNLEQKKRMTFRLKQNRKKSKIKINNYYIEKINDLRMKKYLQNQKNQTKIKKIIKQINNISFEEQKIGKRFKQSEQELFNLRYAVKKMQKMKTDQFIKIKNRIGIQFDKKCIDQQIAEKFLKQIIKETNQKLNISNKNTFQ